MPGGKIYVFRHRTSPLPSLSLYSIVSLEFESQEARRREDTVNILHSSNKPLPIWGILSVALTPLAGLFAHLVTLIIEGIWGSPLTQSYTVEKGSALDIAILGADRAVLLIACAIVALGVISAAIALAKRERPRWLPVLGVVTTAFLIGMALHLAYPD